MIAKLSRFLARTALLFSIIGIVGMTIIIGWQVFARYVLSASPSWAEQSALFLMLWFILFAAAAGVREGFHIRISLMQDLVPVPYRKAIAIVCHAVVASFGLAMIIGGAQLISETWQHDIPTLGLPRGLSYVPLALSGGMICFFATEHVVAVFRGEEVQPLWN